jgi:succinate dehydrogenase / fumarate reductase membrane anchor subunit
MQNRTSSPRKSGAFGWFFQRISGVLLLATLIGHFWAQHFDSSGDYLANPQKFDAIRKAYAEKYPEYKKAIADGKIQDAKNGEHVITYEQVTTRLSNPLWKVFDLLFLIFGLYHGFNGLLNIIDDYARNKAVRLTLVAASWVLAAFLFVQGTLTVFTAGVYAPPLGVENIMQKVATK